MEPAASPMEVPKSGKRPLTAPHGNPIPKPATQQPTTTRSRASAATMAGSPLTSIRARMAPRIRIGPASATSARPAARR